MQGSLPPATHARFRGSIAQRRSSRSAGPLGARFPLLPRTCQPGVCSGTAAALPPRFPSTFHSAPLRGVFPPLPMGTRPRMFPEAQEGRACAQRQLLALAPPTSGGTWGAGQGPRTKVSFPAPRGACPESSAPESCEGSETKHPCTVPQRGPRAAPAGEGSGQRRREERCRVGRP